MFATTLDIRDHADYAAQAHLVLESPPHFPRLTDELRMFWRILHLARRERLWLLRSSWGRTNPDVLAAAIIGLWPRRRRPTIVLQGCMWQPDPGLRGALQRLVVRLADRAITLYVVQSSEEMTLFPQTWGISPQKTRRCLYFATFTERDLAHPPPPPGDYVFAGGNSHRVYEPLLAAARHFPERSFILATNRLQGTPLPPNVTARPVPHREFVALMQGAAAVVVPLRQGMRRAVGQQTYLNSMWLGKPTIVTDGLAVRDHVADGETALVVDGSAAGYVAALRRVLDPANAAETARMGHAARAAVVNQFTFPHHAACLLRVMAEAAER